MYPQIQKADLGDSLFRQLQNDIADYHREAAHGSQIVRVSFYSIEPTEFDGIFALAARLNNGLHTIVTLNRLDSPNDFRDRSEIIVANVPGLFIPEIPRTNLEFIMKAFYADELENAIPVVIRNDGPDSFLFLPGREFSAIDFAYFLGILFRFPLPSGTVTSLFGPRADPFTGSLRFHNGIDIAAPTGTSVFAAGNGRIVSSGTDDILGIFCVIEHPTGFRTIYGHLSTCNVELNDVVPSGTILGAVGDTGRSTGPHLHFEVRNGNEAKDPASFFKISPSRETNDQ